MLRAIATILLRPWTLWVFTACATALAVGVSNVYVAELARMAIVLLGILYFYITFRSGDAAARAKVLWFLEGAVIVAAMVVFVVGVRAALGDTSAPTFRAVLNLVITVVNSLALLICFAAAVFYAGAIHPALVVRKTLVISATAAVLLFVFAAVEHYLVHLVVHGIGVTNSLVTALLAALLGYAFHPLKHRIEHLLKRLAPSKTAHESSAGP